MERSTLAWFRATDSDRPSPLDDTALVIDGLRARSGYDIDVVTAADAHDFVWKHFRRPYHLCVYELRNDRAHAFIPPYLVHYPGIVLLRGRPVGTSRLLYRSRVVVTPHSAVVDALQDEYPGVQVRYIPASVGRAFIPRHTRDDPERSRGVTARRDDLAARKGPPYDDGFRDDIVIDATWPPTGDALTTALAGMAAGKPVVAFESEGTADWPALNPQTWQPRGGTADPILVTIDPRDEQHSLKLAMRRLQTDAVLREHLGATARAWWASHATVDHVVDAWQALIEEARTLAPPSPPENWVGIKDGTEKAREILAEFGVQTDLF